MKLSITAIIMEKAENWKLNQFFVIDRNYSNYISFKKLLEEGKDQILDRIPHFDADPKNYIFLMLRSSGTSGLPKIVMISHYNFVYSLLECLQMNLPKNLRVSMIFPLGHIGGQLCFSVFSVWTQLLFCLKNITTNCYLNRLKNTE